VQAVAAQDHLSRWQAASQEAEKIKLELIVAQERALHSSENQSLKDQLCTKEKEVEELAAALQQQRHIEQQQQRHIELQQQRHIEAQLKQLRDQFQEKCQTLSATRVKLWQTESELLALRREKEETKRSLDPLQSRLITELVKVQSEYEGATQDIASLEELVEQLLGELTKRCVPTLIFSPKK
jgi:chromosome segregation ATPase